MERKETKKRINDANHAHAVGRRKTAKCTINLERGEGDSLVNGKKLEEYFTTAAYKAMIMLPFVATSTVGTFHFTSKVSGGGIAGQADALRLAIARSLSNLNEEFHTVLAKESLLTRDPRAKERKKVFFVRARKRPQYSKR